MLITRKNLKKLQKAIPSTWLYLLQDIHSYLITKWILDYHSEDLTISQKSVMVFSPHQDDETFGCGGMIAQKREQGIEVNVVFITDGRGGIGSEPDKNKVIEIRKQESLNALKILGVDTSAIHFLDQEDGTLKELSIEAKQQTINQISELIKLYQPGEIYVPHYQDCHRDHEATYKLVKDAITQTHITTELIQYPIWLLWRLPIFFSLKLSDISPAYRLSLASVKAKKQQAIFAYSSQIKNLQFGFIKRFLNLDEIFFRSKN